jgi:hypothetical protein
MTGPDESGWNFTGIAVAAIGGLLMIVWQMLNGKIRDNKTHHERELQTAISTLDKRFGDVDNEADLQRGHIAKLFDNPCAAQTGVYLQREHFKLVSRQ